MTGRMLFLFATLAACSSDEPSGPAAAAPVDTVPADILAATWQVRMAKAEVRAPFEGRASWVAWFEGRRVDALPAFKSESDGPALARAHAAYAANYRQAALLAANAILQVYGADRQESDPAETSYLLGVSGLLTARPEEAAKLGQAGSSSVPEIAARDAAWKAWADAKPTSYPDEPAGLAAIVGGPGELPTGGFVPVSVPLVGEPGRVDVGDPGQLLALSRWHEARAREADPTAGAIIDQYLDPFRLPFEAKVRPDGAPATDTWLFMSAYTSAADMQFVSLVSAGDLPAAEALSGASVYAAVAKACLVADKVDVDCVIEQASRVGMALEDAMQAANGGTVEGFHRPFTDYARAGVLRAVDLYARARHEDESSGILRINAYDRNINNAVDPDFILFLAAWDAGNRNTTRATELVHQHIRLVPGLEVARAPLDALHIRLSRNAAPGVPMH